jgi:hypothetical protein
MKYRLRRVGVIKSAVMGGIGYAILSLVFMPFFLFIAFLAPMSEAPMGPGEWMFGPIFVLMMPLIYGAMGFIGTGVAAAVYNLIAAMVGGLDVELEPVAESDVAAPAVRSPMPPPAPPAPPSAPETFTGY